MTQKYIYEGWALKERRTAGLIYTQIYFTREQAVEHQTNGFKPVKVYISESDPRKKSCT